MPPRWRCGCLGWPRPPTTLARGGRLAQRGDDLFPGPHKRGRVHEEGAIAAELGRMGHQGILGQPEFAAVVDGAKGAYVPSALLPPPTPPPMGRFLCRWMVQSGRSCCLARMRWAHDQVVVDVPWDGQPREGGLHVACRLVGVDDHFQMSVQANGKEDAFQTWKPSSRFPVMWRPRLSLAGGKKTMGQSMYPKRLSLRSSSRQFLSTRTYRSRKTFLPRKASMSFRASMPTRLIIRPWAPTTMCFCDSRAT